MAEQRMRSHSSNNRSFSAAILAVILVIVCFVSAGAQETRQLVREKAADGMARRALVIGNASYKASPLTTPANDATDVAAALREAGFEVVLLTDAGNVEMKRAIDEFGRDLRENGGVGLFYFAGYGLQARKGNYLIPVGALVEGEEDVEFEAVNLNRVLERMSAADNSVNIVIVDASRNSPVAGSYRSSVSGLASVDAPSGTLLAYSAAPGTVSAEETERNSLFALELIAQIKRAGISIEDAFKDIRIAVREKSGEAQSPWTVSALNSGFSFDPTVKSEPKVPVQITPAAPEPPAISPLEQAAWDLIKDSSDPGALSVYLKEFPNGVYAPVARIKLTKVENDEWEPVRESGRPEELRAYLMKFPEGVNAPTAKIMLTKMDREAWASVIKTNQKDVMGYLEEFPDGEFAPLAKTTLTRIEKDLWDKIKDSDNPAEAQDYLLRYPDGEYAAEAKLKLLELETEAWNSVKDSRDLKDLEGFLSRYPEGPYSARAREIVEEIKFESEPPPKESRWTKMLSGILNIQATCQPNANQVAVYIDADFQGRCVIRDIGSYASPNAIGLPNDSISSIIVGKRVRVRLCRDYSFRGGCEDLTGDDANLTNNRIGNDNVSSMIVEKR